MATKMSTRPEMIPAAEIFVSRVRDLFSKGLDEREIWTEACDHLRDLLADDQLKRHAETWPDSLAGRRESRGNLLFYEDPGLRLRPECTDQGAEAEDIGP